jgi:hypothetical protein
MNPPRLLRRNARTAGTRPATRRPEVEPLEVRALLSAGVRSADGTGNNAANPTWGSAGSDLVRIAPAAYADGVSSPALSQDQSARAISNILNDQTNPSDPTQDLAILNSRSLSDFVYVWGQFIDHDMDLTPDGGAALPITVAPGDPIGGAGSLPFTRSQFDPNTGTGTGNPRQQVNAVTSFLDLSQVYGSDAAKADALRTHVGGQLKTSPGNMLPYDSSTYFTSPIDMANDSGAVPTDQLFAAGDRRANENIELTALQTLFVRNHNRIAAALQAQHPDWTDEQLYQEARKINIADEEIITYTEFLPAVLGPNALPRYTGYKANVNPGIANEFSTVAFRFGHSMLDNDIERLTNNGLDIADPAGATIDLAQDFFDPNLLNPNGVLDPLTGQTSTDIGPILKGVASGIAQETDLLAVRDVRNLLFGSGAFGGEDLMARDVQRGRDNGIPDYNTLRAAYGLPRVTSFAQITSNVQVQQELRQAYGSVDNIDAFEGGLAENHVAGSDVGPLFQAIMVDQFARLRDGDRFFYLNESWSRDELQLLRQGDSLSKVIQANTDITNLQSNVFIFKSSIGGTVYAGAVGGGYRDRFAPGLPGVTVQLEDADGNVIATTVTDARGRYRFDSANGVARTGDYTVRLVLPTGLTQASANPSPVLISRGGVAVSGVDFQLAPTGPGGGPPGGGGHSWHHRHATALSALPARGILGEFGSLGSLAVTQGGRRG